MYGNSLTFMEKALHLRREPYNHGKSWHSWAHRCIYRKSLASMESDVTKRTCVLVIMSSLHCNIHACGRAPSAFLRLHTCWYVDICWRLYYADMLIRVFTYMLICRYIYVHGYKCVHTWVWIGRCIMMSTYMYDNLYFSTRFTFQFQFLF